MFNNERDKPWESKSKKIIPLKDWHIVCNEYDIRLKEGEEIEIPKVFIENLKTEKVIK